MNHLKSYLLASLTVILGACSTTPKDHFVLQGTLPGAIDSTEVTLVPNGNYSQRYATAYVKDEKFEIQGIANIPTHCKLNINNQKACEKIGQQENGLKYVEIDFFVENGKLIFQTPHMDSLPESFWKYDIRKEKNYSLQGSPAQDIFFKYQQQSIPLRHEIRSRENRYFTNKDFEDFVVARENTCRLEEMTKKFIKEHHHLFVNLYLVKFLKKEPFTYTQSYIDEITNMFASYQDTISALQEFRKYIQEAQTYVQGKSLQAHGIINTKGEKMALLEKTGNKRYSIIDFWASWCGPCRASFPHLREMYKQYGATINFISISVDQDEADWRKALEEEKLPWEQFLATPETVRDTRKSYKLEGIPTFFIVSPDGRIIFSGHNSGELEWQLHKLFKEE